MSANHPANTPPTAGTRRQRDDDDGGDDQRDSNRQRTDHPSPTDPAAHNVQHRAYTTPNFNDDPTLSPALLPFGPGGGTFDIVFALPLPLPRRPVGQPPVPSTTEVPATENSSPASGNPTPTFATTMQLPVEAVLRTFNQFMMAMPRPDQERLADPKRAKVLIKGMEMLPRGLVTRMGLVGGILGAGDTGEDGPACPICYESLDSEGLFDAATAAPEASGDDNPIPESSPTQAQPSANIIALPCRHVFHEFCLVPWFSRHTTCPSCRFNIDPDNLTRSSARIFPTVPASATADPNEPHTTAGGDSETAGNTQSTPPPRTGAPPDTFISFIVVNGPPPSNNRPEEPAPAPQQPQAPQADASQIPPWISAMQPGIQSLMASLFGVAPTQVNITRDPPTPAASTPIATPAQPSTIPPTIAGDENLPAEPASGTEQPPTTSPPPFNAHLSFSPLPFPFLSGMSRPPAPANTAGVTPATGPRPPPVPRPRRRWAPPEGKGDSIRQRVEEKERQQGFRCCDPSCGFAPTDDVPVVTKQLERVVLTDDGTSAKPSLCKHHFHSGCLVSASRVAGYMPEGVETSVEVACPVCRTHGYISLDSWRRGEVQLQETV